ncbi:hypothetical protein GE09DRAFT_1165079, partial [Coniochaeta sp. 2T2.1]
MSGQGYKRYGVENYCFLCDEMVTGVAEILMAHPDEREDTSKLVVLVPFKAENGQFHARLLNRFPTFTHQIIDDYDVWKKAIEVGQQKRVLVELCRCSHYRRESYYKCMLCNPVATLYLAHACCWAVAQKHQNMSPALWASFAYQTRPVTIWMTPEAKAKAFRFRLATNPDNSGSVGYSTSTELGKLLQRVSNLPKELSDNVLANLGGTSVGSILRTGRTLQQLPPRMTVSNTLKKAKRRLVTRQSTIRSLCARQVDILSQGYIFNLGCNLEAADVLHIEVEPRHKIRGLQCAVSRFGLRALRILYFDAPPSRWLGDPSHSWMGTLIGSDLGKLYVVSDELRVIRLEFDDNWEIRNSFRQPGRADIVTQVLWNCDMSLFERPSYLISRGNGYGPTASPHTFPRLAHYRDWRLCCHLPLVRDSGYACGLTIYYNLSGIQGMRAHFQHASVSVGTSKGYPMYMALRDGEYLTSVWTPTCRPFAQWRLLAGDNFLVVTTNLGRTHCFGLLLSRFRDLRWYLGRFNWTRITTANFVRVTGFVLDAMAVMDAPTDPEYCGPAFRDVGITEEMDAAYDDAVADPPCPRFSIWPRLARNSTVEERFTQPFVTTASLSNVAEIAVQRHHMGPISFVLRITHHNGCVEVLGAWDTEDTEDVSTIFAAADGALREVVFWFEDVFEEEDWWKTKNRHFATVTVSVEEGSSTHHLATGPKVRLIPAHSRVRAKAAEFDAGVGVAFAFLLLRMSCHGGWYHETAHDIWCYDQYIETRLSRSEGGSREVEVL